MTTVILWCFLQVTARESVYHVAVWILVLSLLFLGGQLHLLDHFFGGLLIAEEV